MAKLTLLDVLREPTDPTDQLVVHIVGGGKPQLHSEVLLLAYEGPRAPKAVGTQRLLSVGDLRDVIETWSEWRGGRVPNDEERLAAVLHYVENDGYLPVE